MKAFTYDQLTAAAKSMEIQKTTSAFRILADYANDTNRTYCVDGQSLKPNYMVSRKFSRNADAIRLLLDAMGVKYTLSNVAPRAGVIGERIALIAQ